MTGFTDMLAAGYGFEDPAITLGAALEGGTVHPEPKIRVPVAMMNRHGLVAGATGTGKTRTLQLLAEQLSAAGVPVFVADIKGDLSGLAVPGQSNDRIAGRANDIGWAWTAAGVPVEFVSLTGKLGVQLRATVSSFGPLLLGKALSLNETQTSVLTLVFKYADDSQLALLDLPDLRAVLQFLTSDEGKPALESYGGMSRATVGVLLRKLVELEAQGADRFFGEPEFDIHDLLRTTSDGRGVVTCLELADAQDKPALFSTFMMWLLAELYHNLPEAGDLPRPKLVFFFDEAHLLFDDAPKAFLDQIQRVVRLIRSKGVGVYFCTQNPLDIPDDVLGQLGNRVQHALRAFTPRDQRAVRAAAETFRANPALDVSEAITQLGVGEALVSTLRDKGVPSIVERTLIRPPCSRIGPATPEERREVMGRSPLAGRYEQTIDRESAYEVLQRRAQQAVEAATEHGGQPHSEHARRVGSGTGSRPRASTRQGPLEA
ncbi:MAG TPA: helicase HerA-like domain-containing protein, partial [Gemmatimonadales bacterium]|nr:helicase HerA-like domain-containing protein [Gemmatimonadales bacterium]